MFQEVPDGKPVVNIAPAGSLLAFLFAYIFYKSVMKADEGNNTMKEIAGHP